ncbi:MAG: transposase [Spirochaetota bacterium]|nr:transposase [Spirochaetota bacterium]
MEEWAYQERISDFNDWWHCFVKTTVIVVLGIDKKGNKAALGAWEGSTENSRVCTDLLHNLIERGFDLSVLKLSVIDGGKAIRNALNDVYCRK